MIAHRRNLSALSAAGVSDRSALNPLMAGRDGKVQLNLYDPDFTRVEFMEFAPTKGPCCSPFVGKHPGPEEDE